MPADTRDVDWDAIEGRLTRVNRRLRYLLRERGRRPTDSELDEVEFELRSITADAGLDWDRDVQREDDHA